MRTQVCEECGKEQLLREFLKYPDNAPSISNPSRVTCRTCYWSERQALKAFRSRQIYNNRQRHRFRQEGHT